ncbi:hypothetical protein FUAX_16830 [Fulvitalea axinellae]|uniref:NodB homology domain-containing protein n=1 Tax=Fulvitalea axinellae TaxID=1182444 RepID=A0AAU9D8N0_9BACT|nr:hypothetical protein FUAX_16830 [Fulvitalea axinellae]
MVTDRNEGELRVLMYHQIAKPKKDAKIKGLFTTPSQFEFHVKHLTKKGYNFTTFEEISNQGLDKNRKNVVLTFDDGSNCFLKNAMPILRKYSVPAVVYVVAGEIGQKDVVFEESSNKTPIDLLTKEELRELTKEGIEIGSHCVNHVHLARKTKEVVETELIESKKILEEVLGKRVYSIAYPFGNYNEEVMDVAQKSGYDWAVMTKAGSNVGRNRFELFRTPIRGYKLKHYLQFYKTVFGFSR